MTNKEEMVGYKILSESSEQCVKNIIYSISTFDRGDCGKWLACFNPHSFAESLRDTQFSHALKKADWLVADGSGVVFASKILRGAVANRTTGSDIFEGVSSELNMRGGGSVFFLGSTEATLAKICQRYVADYPNLTITGTYSPPFKPEYTKEELREMLDLINRDSPDILWVGMTAPKQEKWIYQQIPELDVKFAAAIGAVFDFYAGNVARSSPIFRKLHLEWLPRLFQEPRRLWRRMFISAPVFIWRVLLQRLSNGDKSGL